MKTALIAIAGLVVLMLLLRRPTTGTGYYTPPGFSGPLPGPNYAVSPPSSPHSAVSDAINAAQAAAGIGFGIWDRISGGSSSGGGSIGGFLSDNSSGGGSSAGGFDFTGLV